LHKDLSSGHNIFLQTTSAENTYSNQIKSRQSTTFTLNLADASGGRYNRSGETYIAYCFSGITGYSKFGSYTGNGSSNGPFVHLGFRASFIMLKNIDRSAPWYIFDIKRNPVNEALKTFSANTSAAEATDSNFLDILSNGFKVRNSGTFRNGNNETLIYLAFAESPFKYSRAR